MHSIATTVAGPDGAAESTSGETEHCGGAPEATVSGGGRVRRVRGWLVCQAPTQGRTASVVTARCGRIGRRRKWLSEARWPTR